MLRRVRERQMRRIGAASFKQRACVPVKEQARRPPLVACDLDVVPAEWSGPARAERFEGRFFGRKTCGIMLRERVASPVAVSSFARRKDALGKARRPLQRPAHAFNLDDVYTDGDDHGSHSRCRWFPVAPARWCQNPGLRTNRAQRFRQRLLHAARRRQPHAARGA